MIGTRLSRSLSSQAASRGVSERPHSDERTGLCGPCSRSTLIHAAAMLRPTYLRAEVPVMLYSRNQPSRRTVLAKSANLKTSIAAMRVEIDVKEKSIAIELHRSK